jgi:hypothetical protein
MENSENRLKAMPVFTLCTSAANPASVHTTKIVRSIHRSMAYFAGAIRRDDGQNRG